MASGRSRSRRSGRRTLWAGTLAPDGADGLRLREVVDIDFGVEARRGYQRIIRNDFGAPTDVTAESPDANAEVNVVDSGTETRIRIGDPAVTFTGRHRYILEYTLATAGVSTGQFLLEVIGNDETFETGRFEVILTGFDDLQTSCDTGAYGAFGGCEFVVDESGNGMAVIEPLAPGDGITVGARFAGLVAARMPPLSEPPDPLPTVFQSLGLLMIPFGLGAAALVFLLGRSYGSNAVLAGGAADAAFGDLPVPGRAARSADTATYRVPDSRLAELATIEFVPPRGLEPWQAAAVLREEIDDDTVAAWFSGMIATDALTISDVVDLGSYDPGFTATWGAIKAEQRSFVGAAGWWSRVAPVVMSPHRRESPVCWSSRCWWPRSWCSW